MQIDCINAMKLNKIRSYFPDDSEDYISEDDINGMDILQLA